MHRIGSLVLSALFLVAGPAVRPLAALPEDTGWIPIGPPGGTASDLVLHPRNPRILWAANQGAGLFKSLDGGASWAAVEGFPFPYVWALAVAPSDPDTLYAAVSVTSNRSGVTGILRSTDGGRSWTLALDCRQSPLPCCGCVPFASGVTRLAVHPRDPRTVFAATYRMLLRSTDGGAVWRRTSLDGQILAMAFDPEDPDIVVTGGVNGVSRSEDGGLSWKPWGEGIGSGQLITALAIDPRTPRRVWAGGSDGVFRSTDGGRHWRPWVSGLEDLQVHALALSFVPGRSRPIVFAGTWQGVVRSLDGGATWTPAGPELQGRSIGRLLAHPGRPGVLWAATAPYPPVATGAGIYKTTDAGAHWRFSSRGFFAVPVSALAFHPDVGGVVWAGSPDFGVYRGIYRGRGIAAGAAWTQRNGIPPHEVTSHVTDLAVGPRDPETLWAAGVYGIHVTDDGGATWQERSEGLIGPGQASTTPTEVVRLAPSDPSTAYTGTFVGLFKTTDAGARWARLATLPNPDVDDVWVDPRDPDVVFVAAGDLWISRDGGATWDKAPVWNAPAVIRTLAADPRNPDVLHAGGENGIFRTMDNGRTWQQVTGFPPERVTDLAVEPTGAVWAITPAGIFRSPDGDTSWGAVPGLDRLGPREIEADPHDVGTVLVGTSAGVFRFAEGE